MVARSGLGLAVVAVVAAIAIGGCKSQDSATDPGYTPPFCDTTLISDLTSTAEVDASTNTAVNAAVKAVQEHEPTDHEQKLLAMWVVLFVSSQSTGAIDPLLLDPALEQELFAIGREYPSFFSECPGSTSNGLGRARQAFINATSDFSCDNDCIPGYSTIENTVKVGVASLLFKGLLPKLVSADIVDKPFVDAVKAFKGIVSGGAKAGKSLTQLADLASIADAKTILKWTADVIAGVTTMGVAVGLVSSSAPIAAAVAAVGIVATVAAVGPELYKAGQLVAKCLDYKTSNCTCHCSVEFIDYNVAGAGASCAKWEGRSDKIPTCVDLTNTTEKCCFCDPNGTLNLNSCQRDLAFQHKSAPTDFEACCDSSGGVRLPRTTVADVCPCGPDAGPPTP